jgi:hypothetical protein
MHSDFGLVEAMDYRISFPNVIKISSYSKFITCQGGYELMVSWYHKHNENQFSMATKTNDLYSFREINIFCI